MQVTLVSTHDVTGGAAKAAFRLHQCLRSAGCQSRLLTRFNRSHAAGVESVCDRGNWISAKALAAKSLLLRAPTFRYKLGRNCDLFSTSRGPVKHLKRFYQPADVLHLHWTTSMVDLASLVKTLPENLPIVWTLHDMNLMTGGCHYNGGCQRFESECGSCPELHSRNERDLANQNFVAKQSIFASLDTRRLIIVAPSRWMQQNAERSKLLSRFETRVIPYGIDTDTFRPDGRIQTRKRLGLKDDEIAVLFVSDNVGNYRKGFDLLREALGTLATRSPIALLVAGSNEGSNQLPELGPQVRCIPLGYITDESRMAESYAAADLFVIPSRQDNLPNTVLESLACGTPVVGFRQGGMTDMVVDGETGLLANEITAPSLRNALQSLLEDAKLRQRMASNTREFVMRHFTMDQCAKRHMALYRERINQLTASN